MKIDLETFLFGGTYKGLKVTGWKGLSPGNKNYKDFKDTVYMIVEEMGWSIKDNDSCPICEATQTWKRPREDRIRRWYCEIYRGNEFDFYMR